MNKEPDRKRVNILILEDCVSDAELMIAHLKKSNFTVTWQRVDNEKDYLLNINAALDLILADYSLPQFDAIRALQLLKDRELDIPFIIVSGMASDEFIVEAMKRGAADFLLKDRMARLATAVDQALDRKCSRRLHEGTQCALRQAMAESAKNQVELEKANVDLGGKNKLLSELCLTAQRFMDDVSHEFRTPLSVIKGYSEIMHAGLAGPVSPEQKKYSQIIIDRTRDMAQMVDDLLDSSKLRAGSLRVDRKPCEVRDIFAALHPIVDSRAASSKIEWVEEIEIGLPQVFADIEKATRVLVNLVVNAIKFSPEGSRIGLSAKAEVNGDVTIGVTDQGQGISPENLSIVFDRFRQVGNSLGSTKGFGLGLDIAKELCALNFGTMNVVSAPGKGSTFSFTLPVNDPEIIVTRLLKRLEESKRPDGCFVILRITPHQSGPRRNTSNELRGFLASSSHPQDVFMSGHGGDSLIAFGFSAKPAGWHRRLMLAGTSIEQFSPTQKLSAFETELLESLPYPILLADAVAAVLMHLQMEMAHA